mmetsp:Transcript_16953/g.48340  ORF Transcript_16953/g.48340 Transcript_16953/m.48340 type:complete len:230 (+) Transcript_16953:704-1393(+)
MRLPRLASRRNPKNRSLCPRRTYMLKVLRRPSAPRLPVGYHHNFEAGRPQIVWWTSPRRLSGASAGHRPRKPSGRRLYRYLRRVFWRVSRRAARTTENTSRANRHSSRVRPAELVEGRRGPDQYLRRGSIFFEDLWIRPPCPEQQTGRRGSSSWTVASVHVYKVLAPRTRSWSPRSGTSVASSSRTPRFCRCLRRLFAHHIQLVFLPRRQEHRHRRRAATRTTVIRRRP